MSVQDSGHGRSPSSSSPSDHRKSFLDASALSPTEYGIFLKWCNTIKPSRSEEKDRIDEQDALRFLREECGIEVQDEIKILSLFERFPLGLLPGHFYALLRLSSWVQRGETPSKALLFTQTSPPQIGIKTGAPVQPPPQHAASPARQPSLTIVKPAAKESTAEAAPRKPSAVHGPAVPPDSSKPANPFRQTSASAGPSSFQAPSNAIAGFDPASNPFRHSKPKIVRPTPIVADASTSVLGAPSVPVVNPFHSGASATSSSPVSGRSVVDLQDAGGPPLPPRPFEGADLRPPPPLPPRHISPLIQAGLHARSEVRKRQEALPPKTFTVLQSTSDRHPIKDTPRLLTGQAAPPVAIVPPSVPKKKSNHGSEPRRSIAEMPGGSATSATGPTNTLRAPVAVPATAAAAVDYLPKSRVGPLPQTVAPQASYVAKGKGVPAWLREQEHLQKSSLLEHHNTGSAVPHDRLTSSRASSHAHHKKRTTSTAQRIEFLDNDSDDAASDEDGTLSEQAKSAASIDRNNPFFQHSRDANKKGVDLKETLSKLAVENAVAKAERDSKYKATSDGSTAQGNSVNGSRPLGRSKTLREASSRSGINGGLPPMVPPRKKSEAPALLNSGTYPGFRNPARVEGPTVGGLRQTPASKKADVGIPASVLAERGRMEREKMDKAMLDSSSRTTPMPPPPPRRRVSSNSQVSVSDSSATTPLSPKDEVPPSLNAAVKGGMRERISELLKGDLSSISERHDWLARAAERAKGGPFDDSKAALVQGIDGANHNDDAPEVDDDYLEEVRRQQRRHQRYSTIDMVGSNGMPGVEEGKDREATPLGRTRPNSQGGPRRATDHIRRSLSGMNAAIVRRSSLLARGSSSFNNDDDDEVEDGSALILDDDGVGPDVVDDRTSIDNQTREEQGWQPLS